MSERPTYSARLPLVLGFSALVLLVGVLGVWSVNTEIEGAIIADGVVVVENNRQIVQHAEGGIVGRILVRDGNVVDAGDLLIELDDTLLRSELAVAELRLIELQARRARLEAERDEAPSIRFPEALLTHTGAAAADQVEGQRVLFAARKETFGKELRQLAEQILQTGNQIEGTEAQLSALIIQEELAREELDVQESALERGLVQSQRVASRSGTACASDWTGWTSGRPCPAPFTARGWLQKTPSYSPRRR